MSYVINTPLTLEDLKIIQSSLRFSIGYQMLVPEDFPKYEHLKDIIGSRIISFQTKIPKDHRMKLPPIEDIKEDSEINDEDRGLYEKYEITHKDGSPVHDFKFVLSPETDRASFKALYWFMLETKNDKLAKDIFDWIRKNHRKLEEK